MENEKKPPPGLKACCACKETKKERDECFLGSANGEVECAPLIEAHKQCLRDLGFKV